MTEIITDWATYVALYLVVTIFIGPPTIRRMLEGMTLPNDSWTGNPIYSSGYIISAFFLLISPVVVVGYWVLYKLIGYCIIYKLLVVVFLRPFIESAMPDHLKFPEE